MISIPPASYYRWLILSLVALLFTACFSPAADTKNDQSSPSSATQTDSHNMAQAGSQPIKNTAGCNNQVLVHAYQQRQENRRIQVLGCGTVTKLLKDDNDGSRHQKFLVSIDANPRFTILVAHNIDLAPRIDSIMVNQPIKFYGEYIYNDKGGVLHWTHKDPASRHQDGWLDYQGKRYW